jgi:hypothetical protein
MLAFVLLCSLVTRLVHSVLVSMIPHTGTPPSYRVLPGVALSETANQIYIYGGRYISHLDDMWRYDLATQTWDEIHFSSSTSPGSRSEAYLIPLESSRKLLLFGGNSKNGPATDLWEFDIDNSSVRYIQWKLIDAKGKSPHRAYYRCYCIYEFEGKKYFAVYGGRGESSFDHSLFM